MFLYLGFPALGSGVCSAWALVQRRDAAFGTTEHTQLSLTAQGLRGSGKEGQDFTSPPQKFKSITSSCLLVKEGSVRDETAVISSCTCFADGHVTSVTQTNFAVGSLSVL